MILDHPAATETRVVERAAVDADTFTREIVAEYRPVVLRGQAAHWEAVRAGRAGDRAMAGPPSSMVDFDAPDLVRYPRFAETLGRPA